MSKEPTFTPKEDVIEHYKDGSGSVVVARAGKSIPWAMARNLGLVKGEPPEEKKPDESTDKR